METHLVKSQHNPSLIEEILKLPMAEKWTSTNHKPYSLVEVHPNSSEYHEVESRFLRTGGKSLIKKIERIENPFLLGQYLLNKEKLSKSGWNRPLSPLAIPLPDDYPEYFFFHGTTRSCVRGICTNNFNWRKYGSSRGCKFGRGVSFTPKASYAIHFTKSENVIFLATVLNVTSTPGNELTILPPDGYDATSNGKGTVYVKYEDNEFYPEYVIYY